MKPKTVLNMRISVDCSQAQRYTEEEKNGSESFGLYDVSECDHEPISDDDDLIEVCKHCGETYYDMP